MATEIGTGTSYPITVPVGSDNADIQTALRYITYGIGGTPTSDSQITSNCIFGKMKLLAPKASPVFTGNGSIAGNFTVGGNLVVSGTIDNDQGTNATFNDKTLTIGNANTTDADADENGIVVKGATYKKFIFQNGTGWESTENLNLATNTKTYQIAGTTVLSKDQVLGKTIGGTSTGDIASIDGTQTLTNKTITSVSGGSNGMIVTGTNAGNGLVQAPHMVISRATATTATSSVGGQILNANIFPTGKLSSLTPASTYKFKFRYYLSVTGVGAITLPFTFSSSAVSIIYSLKTYPQTMGTTTTRQGMGTTFQIAPTANAAGNYVVEAEGFFETHATTTTWFEPMLTLNSTAAGQVASITAGSYIELQRMGLSSQANIAGNWS